MNLIATILLMISRLDRADLETVAYEIDAELRRMD